MTKQIKGPGIFLAQFIRPEAPYNSLDGLCRWVSSLGYRGVQIPAWESPDLINLDLASESESYCDDFLGKLKNHQLELTELNAALAGQVMAIHSAYEVSFQPFYPEGLNDNQRVEWATRELMKTVTASAKLGLSSLPVLSGGLAWHFAYPWPQRPEGLVDEAFKELARRWKPVLDHASECGVKIAFELHPGSDLFDGYTFERFVDELHGHPSIGLNYDPSHFVLQHMDYLEFIRLYGDRICGFHVKDAELRPNGKGGVYGGYQGWAGRPGRFRSLGDGQVDFKQVFTLLTEAGYRGWAVMEWECALKSPEQGAREGAQFIRDHLIEVSAVAFDDFAGSENPDNELNRRILGLS